MRKKSWLIGVTALAAVAVFGALGMHSVKATGAESESAKEQIIFEQVKSEQTGLDSYYRYSSNKHGIMLSDKDSKYYAKIDSDGTLTELDNSDGKYKTIALSSSASYDNTLLSIDDNNYGAILNYDGSFAYGTDKYYKNAYGINVSGKFLFAFNEDGKINFNDKNGNKVFDIELPDDDSRVEVKGYGRNIQVAIYNEDTNKYKYTTYDENGNQVDKLEHDSAYYYGIDSLNSRRIFTESSDVTFENNEYQARYVGVLKGQKVYLASHKVAAYSYTYAILDSDGNVIVDNTSSDYNCAFGDLIVTRNRKNPDDKKSEYEYHIVKAVLATELKKDDSKNSVAEITAEDANLSPDVTYDELDADAKTVYDQKFNFNVKAADGVLADGAYISIAKAVTGSDYETAKEVTKDVASHIAVFNIDLLKDGAKIQPNGNIEFTVNVPTGFNSDLVAVYRLSSDGKSYTKLSSSVKDGKVVFTTDHFSTYMIVEEKQAVKPDDNTAADDNNNSNTSNNDKSNVTDDNTGNGEQAGASDANAADSTPGTGDVSNYIYYVIAIVCAAVLGVVAMTAKNKKKAR